MVIKNVHVIFSDGDRHIYKEGDMKASKEFLEQSDINNHVIVTPEHLEQLERKAETFDQIKEYTLDKIEMFTTRQEFAPNSNKFEYFGNLLTAFKVIKYKISDLERGSDE